MKAYASWVVADSHKQELRCNRCGVREPLSSIYNRPLDYAVGVMRLFGSLHLKCQPRQDIPDEPAAEATPLRNLDED
jgi:hypothetical protein